MVQRSTLPDINRIVRGAMFKVVRRHVCLLSHSGVAKSRGAIVHALLVEKAFKSVSAINIVFEGPLEQHTHGGYLFPENAAMKGYTIAVVRDGMNSRLCGPGVGR